MKTGLIFLMLFRFCYQIIIGKKKILVVDDEVFNLMVIINFCKTIDIPIEKALSGKEAIQKIQDAGDYPIDLIFMDVNMPIMDGYETTTELRRLEIEGICKEIIILGLTAYVSKEKKG